MKFAIWSEQSWLLWHFVAQAQKQTLDSVMKRRGKRSLDIGDAQSRRQLARREDDGDEAQMLKFLENERVEIVF